MKRAYPLLLVLAVLAAGCGDDFPDEEMHFGIEDKVRPYAVLVEPPDAAPGDEVTVTLLVRAPDPDEVDVSWRVALDFDRGLYEADEVERRYVALDPPLPAADADGFMTQTFTWTVPDSVHLWSSALPAVLTDAATVALAEQLIGPAAGSPPRKAAVDAWLRALDPADVAALAPPVRQAVWALADRFACQVRFRARLRTDITVDVTRNLTVRHTSRLGGPNVNRNAQVTDLAVVALDKKDADRDDIDAAGITKSWHRLVEAGVQVAERVAVPVRTNWTYYAVVAFAPESYTSPYDYAGELGESGSYRWYYYRQDAPRDGHHLFVTEDGDEAEMWHLDEEARMQPPGVGAVFRLVAVVRDERPEWRAYQAAPGTGVAGGIVEFVAP
jgi:hypothetical protein